MIDINKRDELFTTLYTLREDQQPIFGLMTAQHMVEHLIWSVTFCNGKFPQQQITTPEMAIKLRPVIDVHNKAISAWYKNTNARRNSATIEIHRYSFRLLNN
jgi:hypothetical protein